MRIVGLSIEVLAAFVLYVIAPASFNSVICVAYMILYAFQLWGLFRLQSRDRSWLSFNSLFFIMLTMVSYVVPVLYLLGFSSQIITIISYNDSYLFLSLFINSVAVSFYKIGYYKGENKKDIESTFFSDQTIKRVLYTNSVLVVIATVVFLASFTVAKSLGAKDISGLTVTLINCVFIFGIVFSGFSNINYQLPLIRFLIRHKIIYICTAFIVLNMLRIGDRYTPICLVVTTLFVINRFVHKFTFMQFMAIIASGMIVLAGVSLTRNTGGRFWNSGLKQDENKTVYFQDIIPINLDFYLGLEWKDKNGLFNPARIVYTISYPIPFLPSYIAGNLFDGDVSSGQMLTMYNRGLTRTSDDSGIGTHAIVDIFMSWGWIGVVLLFYLFGFLVGMSSKKSNDIYYLLIYACLVSRAIYIPRETLFTPYRDIVYLLLLASFILPKKSNYVK